METEIDIKTPIEWNDFAEDFLDADGNIFRADQIATALNLATEALGQAKQDLNALSAKSWLKPMKRNEFAKQALQRLIAEHKGENGISTN